MDVQANLRQDLHKLIDTISDVTLLKAVYTLLEQKQNSEHKEVDFYNDPNPLLQASIERGLEQIKNEQTISHEEVKKRYAKWLK